MGLVENFKRYKIYKAVFLYLILFSFYKAMNKQTFLEKNQKIGTNPVWIL